MCGLIGYVGSRVAAPLLLDGLERLEYRGYDSAGICLQATDGPQLTRSVGNVERLRSRLIAGSDANAGVGHTRWATHGRVCERNAHPLPGPRNQVTIVLNGIIENYTSLRREFTAQGADFRSDTDAEVLAHLVEHFYEGDLVVAVRSAHVRLEGHFAYVVLHRDHPSLLVGGRLQCPLVVGVGKNERFLASSVAAVLPETRRIQLLEDNEIVAITATTTRIFSLEQELPQRDVLEMQRRPRKEASKQGHDSYMLKEIEEQPQAVARTLSVNASAQDLRPEPADGDLSEAQRIVLVACGTSYHAGLVATHMLEAWTRVSSECHVASEWRYRDPVLTPGTLVIGISQSGETADTIGALRLARAVGARTLAITNSPGSQITREVDTVLFTDAGPEIGVAATKTFTTQVALLGVAALRGARLRSTLSRLRIAELEEALYALPELIGRYLRGDHPVQQIAQRYHSCPFFVYLGRQAGLAVSLEGALKLKEIAYVPAEAYPAGEMKHGPIALLEEDTPVVTVATDAPVYKKLLSNIQEARARGATVIAIATDGNEAIQHLVDDVIFVPRTNPYLQPILAVLPLQQLAYHIARLRNANIDQPRNLAKTVTVE